MASSILHQWLSLVGAIWLQSINGTNSNFPSYSSQLKQLLSISQIQLNNLAFASDAGKLLGWLSGVAAVYLPLWLVLLIGATLGLVGYGLQYLFITNQISSISYAHIFLLTVLAGNSICWINTVCYVVIIRNFPSDYRQVAVGIMTSYLGLSAKVYTVVVNAIYSSTTERAKAYLLFNSVFPLIACVLAAPLVRGINSVGNSRKMKGGFIVIFLITIATGIYAIIGSFGSVLKRLAPLNNLIGMVTCLLLPLVIPLVEKIRDVLAGEWWLNKEIKVHSSIIEENTIDLEKIENENVSDQNREEAVKEEIGVKLMLQRVEFWLYFFVYFFGATLGLVFLNNLGQIAESRGYSGTSSLVSLSSSFGFFGRLIPSLLDYVFSRSYKYMIPSPASIAALMAPMAGAFILLLNKSNIALYTSTAIIGVCTGAITSISVSTTTELFGSKNFSVNHNVVVANISIGSFLFGYLAAFVYRKQGNYEDGKCMGMDCYRNTFILWGCFCLFGTFLALILYARTRKFYSQRCCM
ncbi:protein NUCLEAR FUSION DEFECTIVE 4 [Melia azedarach]|uniref:Protein NUCLEAR FUSION DEFECTIVE 4 n=1 Tax=Melia azedarach TaxID=155640 RepID=A0ACC1Y770_MELAZ|nr:protein NUCLEAR FUSION DEFECTIVE 4 [Melia azedarach]